MPGHMLLVNSAGQPLWFHRLFSASCFRQPRFCLFTCFDTASKFLSRDYSIFQIMSVEFVTATVLLVLFAGLKNRNNPERRTLVMNRPSLHLLRGIVQILGQSFVFLAIPHLSLAEFYVIIFCMPIITVLKVGWFLKERPAAFVWPVLAVNFVGVLIALRPDQGMNVWALVALAGTVLLAGSLVVLRKMMESETPEMVAITASAALAMGALAVTAFVYKSVAAPDLRVDDARRGAFRACANHAWHSIPACPCGAGKPAAIPATRLWGAGRIYRLWRHPDFVGLCRRRNRHRRQCFPAFRSKRTGSRRNQKKKGRRA